ncbi:hypothetical protein AYO41_03465 [Verrucomicrobia bacterium SCGC AG-212-E04]|nr:hypothetical protein AYO41_03465 [Verrucomicrobia bacterium SCGC AG-212-E04]
MNVKAAFAILGVGLLLGTALTAQAQETEEYMKAQLDLAQAGEKLFQRLLTTPDEWGFRAYDAGRALTERSQMFNTVTLVINESTGRLSPAGKLLLAKSLRMWIQLTEGDLETLGKVAGKNPSEDVRQVIGTGQRVGSRLLGKLRDALKVMES